MDAAPYDFDAIAHCYAKMERSEQAWDALGDADTVVYEALDTDYAGTIERVASTLGATGVKVARPSTRRLADTRSAILAARFRADLGAPRPA